VLGELTVAESAKIDLGLPAEAALLGGVRVQTWEVIDTGY
jgi:hypothetical protein